MTLVRCRQQRSVTDVLRSPAILRLPSHSAVQGKDVDTLIHYCDARNITMHIYSLFVLGFRFQWNHIGHVGPGREYESIGKQSICAMLYVKPLSVWLFFPRLNCCFESACYRSCSCRSPTTIPQAAGTDRHRQVRSSSQGVWHQYEV